MNTNTTAAPTLYQDWQARLRRLHTSAGPLRAYFPAQKRLFEMLLERGKDSPAATRVARFPLPTAPFADRRSLMVIHQLGKTADVPGIKTEQEASSRASSILKRLKTLDLQGAAKTYVQQGVVQATPAAQVSSKGAYVSMPDLQRRVAWKDIEKLIAVPGGFKLINPQVLYAIESAYRFGSALPDSAAAYLCCHLYNPEAVQLLVRCESPNALENALVLWRQRIEGKRKGPVRLVDFFHDPKRQVMAAERFRRELIASPAPKVRLQATRMLGVVGTLDDVGLLSDLLPLPRLENEDARERGELVRAMERIARTRLEAHY